MAVRKSRPSSLLHHLLRYHYPFVVLCCLSAATPASPRDAVRRQHDVNVRALSWPLNPAFSVPVHRGCVRFHFATKQNHTREFHAPQTGKQHQNESWGHMLHNTRLRMVGLPPQLDDAVPAARRKQPRLWDVNPRHCVDAVLVTGTSWHRAFHLGDHNILQGHGHFQQGQQKRHNELA